jgi:hypothetical protein
MERIERRSLVNGHEEKEVHEKGLKKVHETALKISRLIISKI